jgi:uncharacterized protein YndB with AHSA1/START domain
MTRDLLVTRIFDAPVERVFNAWRDPDQVMQWWGPTGFTCPSARMDFREGGTSLVCMRPPQEFPGGVDLYNTWAYTRIVPNQLIEYILDWADQDGNRLDPETLGLPPGMPRDVHNTNEFKDLGNGKTELTVTEHGYDSEAQMELSRQGLEQCLDKMAASLAKS